MRRRTLTAGLGGAAAMALLPKPPAIAQQRARSARVGYLGTVRGGTELLLAALRELGWGPGSLVIEARWSEGRLERLPELASELVSSGVDVIVAASPPALRAAQQATRTIPIVMFAVANPVELGFIASLSHPGGNITGVTSAIGDLTSKHLDLVKETIPSATRVGLLYNEGNPLNYATARRSEIISTSGALGLQLVWLGVRRTEDFEAAFARAGREGADAVIGIGDPVLFAERARIHELAERHRIPIVWGPREYLDGKGLLSYGPSFQAALHQVAHFVDRILRGASPANLPVERPTTYQLVINLKAARGLGLAIPYTLLARADEVIE